MPRTTTTRVVVRAPRDAVYAALLDPDAIAAWRVPDGMSAVVHEWSAVEGGRFRVSLTYADPSPAGKSGAHTDTYAGHFARLVPPELVVEVLAFETSDAALGGEMTLTTSLREVAGGSEVELVHAGLPDRVAVVDNETGSRMALGRLAAFVEGRFEQLG